jgi:lysophospholipid acyltransferase (LPLAT)-like uncharacterized protein
MQAIMLIRGVGATTGNGTGVDLTRRFGETLRRHSTADPNSSMLRKLLPYLIWAFFRLWTSTWRLREGGAHAALRAAVAAKRPVVFAFWHGDELALLPFAPRYPVAAMVSTSRDGDLMTKVLNLIGVQTSRGSSTRGGISALKGILRLSREGLIPMVAVDGPRGPFHQPKPGVFELSALLRAEIYPACIACSGAFVFKKSWNKTYLPWLFARVSVFWGEPMPAVDRVADPRDPRLAEQLAARLDEAGRAARRTLAPAPRSA